MSDKIFNDDYISQNDETPVIKESSELKKFLKQVSSEDALEKYGSTKPKRVIIRAKIYGDKG